MEGAKVFWVVHNNEPSSSGYKLGQRRFQLNRRRNFFRVRESWSRLPREIVWSPSLETSKPCLDVTL